MRAATGLAAGFDDPVHQSQRVFRQVLDAMAHPGQISVLTDAPAAAPAGLSPAAAAIALTLLDFESSVWLDDRTAAARDYLVFHSGCPVTDSPNAADFAVLGEATRLDGLERFRLGSDEHPERGATLLVEVAGFSNGDGAILTGPGIDGERRLRVSGVPAHFWATVRENGALFPRGVDLLLTCAQRIAALPRSVRVEC